MAMNKLFVYGTLKKGRSNHQLFLGNAKFIGEGKTKANVWQLLDLGAYPAMTYGGVAVHGEVYEVTDHELNRIDRLEGLDVGLYERHIIDIDIDGEEHHCETYLMFDVVTLGGLMEKATNLSVW